MTDRNITEEARHDFLETANEVLVEQGRAYAQTEYESGELNDWVEDNSDPHDNFLLAHALVQWLDSGEPMVKLAEWMPVLSLKDFRASRDHVVELKARMIAEDL